MQPTTFVLRPGLQQAMESLREGDILVVWRLDRLGRSLRNLLELVAQLEDKKVGFRSLQEKQNDHLTLSGCHSVNHLSSLKSA